MKKTTCSHLGAAACVLVALCVLTMPSYGDVTADPTKVMFTSPQQSATIRLSSNGVSIPKTDIGGWQFIASGHDYSHMLRLGKVEGAVQIAPSETLEVGSYDLKIDTTQGPVVVRVFAPLSEMPDIIEKTAALTGESEEMIKARLGLTTILGREEIQIDLAPVYYEGQTLTLTLPAQPGRSCSWFINGGLVAENPERNTLAYTFTEAGVYVLTYLETENKDGKPVPAARAIAYTRVVPMPSVLTEVAVNSEVSFEPPAGYQKYTWRIDNVEVSTEPVLKYTFRAPGTHAVECRASSPREGSAQEFQRVRYNTTVK